MAHSSGTARLLLVVLSLIWGSTWPAMKIALDEIPPFSMRVATTFLGAATLWLILRLQQRDIRVTGRNAATHLVVASLLNIVGFTVPVSFALLYAATSRVAILVYTMPVWACLLAWLVLGERLTAPRAFALALCVVGVGILVYPLLGADVPAGILISLGAGALWGAGTVYLKWSRIAGDPVAIAGWQLIVGFLAVMICQPLVEGGLPTLVVSPLALLCVLFTGVVGSGIAYVLWFTSVRELSAATASLGVLAAPVVGVIASIVVLGDRPSLTDIVGFALILAAAAIVLLGGEEVRVQPEPS